MAKFMRSTSPAQREITVEERERTRRDIVLQSLTLLAVATISLVILGVLMVYSATAATSIRAQDINPEVGVFSTATKQALSAGIGIVGALILGFGIPYDFYRNMALPILLLGYGLQGAVIAIGGEGVGGNNNWLNIGGFSLQPSEFLKLATIIWLASALSRLDVEEVRSWSSVWLPCAGLVGSIVLVIAGKDMGTSLIFVLIGAGMIWMAGLSIRQIVFPAVLVVLFAGMLVAANPSRLARIGQYFENLFVLPDTVTPTQSDYALFGFGTGGFTGVGIGAGKEKWNDLKAAHTDYIFAVVGEELGLVGVLAVIALIAALAWAIFRIALNHPDRFGQLVCTGAGLWLCGQALANMLVVTGLLPVFGVPLPFLSMGGSSMLAALFMVGVVFSCGLGVPGVHEALQVRSRIARQARALVRR